MLLTNSFEDFEIELTSKYKYALYRLDIRLDSRTPRMD